MGRTSISISETTKTHLDSLKRDDETWDDLLTRLASTDDPIQSGVLSEKEVEQMKQSIRDGRERGESD